MLEPELQQNRQNKCLIMFSPSSGLQALNRQNPDEGEVLSAA